MNKIHESWIALSPSGTEYPYSQTNFTKYYNRIIKTSKFNHIPKAIFEQWIYPHHDKLHTLNNYAWIDFEKTNFDLIKMSITELESVSILSAFKANVLDGINLTDFKQLSCHQKDLSHWGKYGTWRTPPIIIDTNSLVDEIPIWSEISPPLQLVEGHSRFRYLYSLKRITELKKGRLALDHLVYLMKRDHKSETKDQSSTLNTSSLKTN